MAEEVKLPVDRMRGMKSSYEGGEVRMEVEEEVYEGLVRLARESQASMFMVVQAAVGVWMMRMGGGEDIAIGSPVAGRPEGGMEEMVGLFVNTLVMRMDLRGNPSFREMVERVRKGNLEGYGNQDVPFEEVVEAMKPERSLGRHPLFQVMVLVEGGGEEWELEIEGAESEWGGVELGISKFDLMIQLKEKRGRDGRGRGMEGRVEYSKDLFERKTVERMVKWLKRVMEEVSKDWEKKIGSVEVMGEEERRRLVEEWSGEEREVRGETLVEVFEEQVERSGEEIAVVCGKDEVSYGELNERANRVAHALRGRGVGAEDVVGLAMGRSVEMVVAMLGILKAGGAYTPMEVGWPKERKRWML
jgi:non-ribosomal peptide synthetase component F